MSYVVDVGKKPDVLDRAEIVRWVSESLRPFKIVEDRGFQSLMKTGRPEYYIPSASTVSRDVKLVFAKTRERIAKMLQVRTSKPQLRANIDIPTGLRRRY
jgi:hypothetical protein